MKEGQNTMGGNLRRRIAGRIKAGRVDGIRWTIIVSLPAAEDCIKNLQTLMEWLKGKGRNGRRVPREFGEGLPEGPSTRLRFRVHM